MFRRGTYRQRAIPPEGLSSGSSGPARRPGEHDVRSLRRARPSATPGGQWETLGLDNNALQERHVYGRSRPIRVRNSVRVATEFRKLPSMAEVVIIEFCFSTPRIIMHRC
jgi:hypothetical protein